MFVVSTVYDQEPFIIPNDYHTAKKNGRRITNEDLKLDVVSFDPNVKIMDINNYLNELWFEDPATISDVEPCSINDFGNVDHRYNNNLNQDFQIPNLAGLLNGIVL